MIDALSEGKISEGHTRPLLMLIDRPMEQTTLYKEILLKRMTVREAELIARKIAVEKARKIDTAPDPELIAMEERLAETLGTRVKIEKKQSGGKIVIDFFSGEDLESLLSMFASNSVSRKSNIDVEFERLKEKEKDVQAGVGAEVVLGEAIVEELDDRTPEEKNIAENTDSDDIYILKNFSL